MTSRDFVYWLQGFFEISKSSQLNEEQVKMVKNHLALVFIHEIDEPDPDGKLQDVHDGITKEDFEEIKNKLNALSKVTYSGPPKFKC